MTEILTVIHLLKERDEQGNIVVPHLIEFLKIPGVSIVDNGRTVTVYPPTIAHPSDPEE